MLPNAVPKPKSTPKVRVSLKHGKPLTRTKFRNGAGSKRRKGHLFPKNVDEPYRDWIRSLPCLLAGKVGPYATGPHVCVSPVQVCHVKSRGAGGSDRQNCVPMCASAHDQQHGIGIREFEQRWGVSLTAIARQLTAVYEAEKFPCP